MTIVINKQTAKGLDVSIRKWERVVESHIELLLYKDYDNFENGRGRHGCGLCTLYNLMGTSDRSADCVNCPIRLKTGKNYRRGTPYDQYEVIDLHGGEALNLAKAELQFLIDLKAECKVVPGVKNHVEAKP